MASFKGYLYIEFLGSLSMCFSMLNFWGLVNVCFFIREKGWEGGGLLCTQKMGLGVSIKNWCNKILYLQ